MNAETRAPTARFTWIVVLLLVLLVGPLHLATAAASPAADTGASAASVEAAAPDLGSTDRLLIRRDASERPGRERSLVLPDGVAAAVTAAAASGFEVLELAEDLTLEEATALADRLMTSGLVQFAEADPRVSVTFIPNDPDFPKQWGPQQIEMPKAWDISFGGTPGPVVAVLDTGVDEVSELSGRVLPGWNSIDGTTQTSDGNGHGTLSATVVAAEGNNSVGIAGQCWTCRILPVKVLDDVGGGSTSTVADGIIWAADNGADVINLSLGALEGSDYLAAAVSYAHSQGVVLVGAAGNDGTSDAYYPAAYPEVISVAGSRSDGSRYEWSNHGPTVDIAAPGCNYTQGISDEFGWYCGTSSATPIAAGIAGLRLAVHPSDPPTKVRDVTMAAATSVSYVASGIVHGPRTLNGETEVAEPNPGPTAPALSGSRSGLSAKLNWSAATGGNGSYSYSLHRTTGSTCSANAPRIVRTPKRNVTDDGLKHDTTYRYCVRATDGSGSHSPMSNTIRITTPKPAPPSWPEGSRLAFDLATGGVRLSWPAAQGVGIRYDVFRDGSRIATTTGRTQTVTGSRTGQRYHLEVRARDSSGQTSPRLSRPVTPASGFRDVSRTSTFAQDIRWLATGEITRGCNPPTNDRFCPEREVSREQMAAFMVRALGLTETSGVGFRDVPRGSTFAADIDRLATAGITRGCNPPTNDRFCPEREVSREQMAALMRRALGA